MDCGKILDQIGRTGKPPVRPAVRRGATSRHGLTLVELLVAIVILTIALAAYLNVALASRASVDKGQYLTMASQLAGDRLADYQGLGYSSLPAYGTYNYTLSNLPNGTMSVVIGYMNGNSANANITQIDVTVTWGLTNSKLPQEAGSVKQSLLVSKYP